MVYILNMTSEGHWGEWCETHLQPWVDAEAAHHGIHAGHVLAASDFLEHHLLSIIPKGQKTEP